MSDWTEAALRAHVQGAVELELFTIPAYLSAYYSIRQGRSKAGDDAAEAIRGIVNQEMLHLELVCNLSNAIGQRPALTGRAAPRYPGRVPFDRHDAEIVLGPASASQIQAFMTLELPTWLDPGDAPAPPPEDRYDTIGELYHGIMRGLREVYGDGGAPWPAPASPQVWGNFQDDGFAITDLASALRALDLVVLQGEGASQADPHDDDPRELAHYYQLQAIAGALGPDDLRPMIANAAGVTWSARCEKLLGFFDAVYADLIRRLEAAFHGQGTIGTPVGLMYAALHALAVHVVEVPYQAEDGGAEGPETLTPRFRYTTATPAEAYAGLDPADRGSDAVKAVAAALQIATG